MKSWPKTDRGNLLYLMALVLIVVFGIEMAQAQNPPVMREGVTMVAPTQYTDQTPIAPNELTNVMLYCGTSPSVLPQQMPLLNPAPGATLKVSKDALLAHFAFNFNKVYYCNATATAANGLTSERSQTINFTVPDERSPEPPPISVQ
jgi:hypothetical protein